MVMTNLTNDQFDRRSVSQNIMQLLNIVTIKAFQKASWVKTPNEQIRGNSGKEKLANMPKEESHKLGTHPLLDWLKHNTGM